MVAFSYDANGNLTSVTPPARPAHTFTYTPLDFAASYTPPALAGTGATQYRYNRDRQVVGIDRPDGLSTGFQYDPGGRLSGVVLGGSGTLTYGYTAGGHVGTVTMPDGQGLTYTYDGFLPLSEQWTGVVSGQVTRSYQVDASSVTTLQVTSETVSSTPAVTFSYDTAGLMSRAGVSVLTRNDVGVATTVQVGGATGVTETLTLNSYGEPATRETRWGGSRR